MLHDSKKVVDVETQKALEVSQNKQASVSSLLMWKMFQGVKTATRECKT